MKVTVTIPDPIFDKATWLAHYLGMTRSGLYARALEAFIEAQDPDWITNAMNKVVDAVGAEPDPLVRAQARLVLKRVEW